MIYIIFIIIGTSFILLSIYLFRVYKYSIIPRYNNDKGMELYEDYLIDFNSQVLGCYYGDFIKGIRKFDRDENGVVRWLNHRGTGKTIYNPTMIAEWALITHDRYIHSKSDADLFDFKNQIDWLVNNATEIDKDKVCWYYNFDFGNEKAPWGSGIAQGMSICALLRAYQFYGKNSYLDLAIKSYNMLELDYSEGGFKFSNEKWELWYEEDNFQNHILNGHIYALLGVYDLFRVTQEKKYYNSFTKGLKTIKDNIGVFDMGFNTKYDAFSFYPANNSYPYTHITQFKILFNITNDHFFKDYAVKFENYFFSKSKKIKTFLYILQLDLKAKINKIK